MSFMIPLNGVDAASQVRRRLCLWVDGGEWMDGGGSTDERIDAESLSLNLLLPLDTGVPTLVVSLCDVTAPELALMLVMNDSKNSRM
jgi:hypothetical protein